MYQSPILFEQLDGLVQLPARTRLTLIGALVISSLGVSVDSTPAGVATSG